MACLSESHELALEVNGPKSFGDPPSIIVDNGAKRLDAAGVRIGATSSGAARGQGGRVVNVLTFTIPAFAIRPTLPPATLLGGGLGVPSGRIKPAEVGPSARSGRHEAVQAQGGSPIAR